MWPFKWNLSGIIFAWTTVETLHNSHREDKKEAFVERFKQESMYGLSAKKVAVVERWPLVEFRPYLFLRIL